jgi:hypothetical protein
MVAETEERRDTREIVPGQPIGTVHLEQLDEVPALELDETIRSSHAVVMGRAGSQSKAESLVTRRGSTEVAYS